MILNESPKDSLGRPLAEGDGVILMLNGPVLFRVAQIETNLLDPRAPVGLMKIHLFATATFTVKAGAKHMEFLRVGTLQEMGPMPFEMNMVAAPSKETP